MELMGDEGASRRLSLALKGGVGLDVEGWRARLRDALPHESAPLQYSWNMGGTSAEEYAEGARCFVVTEGECFRAVGGEAAWMGRADVGEEGYVVDHIGRLQFLRRHTCFDAEGYVWWVGPAPIPAVVAMVAHARELRRRAEVTDEPICKYGSGGCKVNLRAQRLLWERLSLWVSRIGADAVYSVDEGWDRRSRVAARAAVRHDGVCVGGRLDEDAHGHHDVSADNYVAEVAALLDALQNAWEAGYRRVVLVFDAASGVHSWLRFRRLGARARAAKWPDALLSSLDLAVARLEAVVFLWQTSHVGEPLNDMADAAVAEF